MLSAGDALRIGLFNRVAANERVVDETLALAARLAAKPPLAVALTKQSIREGLVSTLPEALDRERINQMQLFHSAEARAAIMSDCRESARASRETPQRRPSASARRAAHLSQDAAPERLVVVGAGTIGCSIPRAHVMLSPMNFGALPTVGGASRLQARVLSPEQLQTARAQMGLPAGPNAACRLGLATETPDSLDWDDEVRQAIETRTSLSPDALTGMEANLRFPMPETQGTRVFGRLSAWQNWVFSRPNAVGAAGALKVYGTGAPSKFDWGRV
jgi:benzoyl-CoA-dihydrodiol lyase